MYLRLRLLCTTKNFKCLDSALTLQVLFPNVTCTMIHTVIIVLVLGVHVDVCLFPVLLVELNSPPLGFESVSSGFETGLISIRPQRHALP